MTISRTWEVEDLARVAYTAYEQAVRAALPGHQGIEMPLFSELSPSLQEVWRHVAITVWSEIWNELRLGPLSPFRSGTDALEVLKSQLVPETEKAHRAGRLSALRK